jgi:hypothetical protein
MVAAVMARRAPAIARHCDSVTMFDGAECYQPGWFSRAAQRMVEWQL